MRDKSKQLLVINTGKKESGQTGLPSQSGTTHIIGGGGLSVNMSDYLLKSIWDKVFEVRTDSQGIEYIFGKLPMVAQYGITMYSGDGVDVPSLASGLPFDGRTIWYNPNTNQIEVIGGTGGGSGEGVSNFWDLSGIPSWITISKPKYTYTEIEGTPDLSVYALKTQIPSLSGYATESWVTKQNYATKATTLSGYGITDAYTKTNVDDLLKAYVTLGGTQTITGEKNFTGGLKVNGSPIVYDSSKKYWKLEGDLLVTGGVTMYGNEGTYTPSTIMDAIAVDGTTISKSGGVLKVIGGTGGGVADSVAWANITGKPTWIGSTKPSYSYSEITGAISTTELQNYLTSNSYLNVTSGDNRYLKLSGGTINGAWALDIKRSDGNYASLITFSNTSGILGYVGFTPDKRLAVWSDLNLSEYTIWHNGNDGSGSGLDADLLDGVQEINFCRHLDGIPITSHRGIGYGFSDSGWIANGPALSIGYSGDNYLMQLQAPADYTALHFRNRMNGTWGSWKNIAFTDSNVASATKLQTARTIWGQSFDGSGNINGDFYLNSGRIGTYGNIASANTTSIVNWKGKDGTSLGYVGYYADHMIICNTRGGTTEHSIMELYDNGSVVINGNNGGNVGIGTTSPEAKLHVVGEVSIYGGINSYYGSTNGTPTITMIARDSYSEVMCSNRGVNYNCNLTLARLGGNVGIGTTSPSQKLHVNGNILATGGITMYSQRSLKNIISQEGLSLEELNIIKPTRFTWKDNRDNLIHYGGIADDIMKILPEVVIKDSEGILTMDYGNAAFVIASSLIKPVIDHEQRIAMLEEENKQLRQEVERLKSA